MSMYILQIFLSWASFIITIIVSFYFQSRLNCSAGHCWLSACLSSYGGFLPVLHSLITYPLINFSTLITVRYDVLLCYCCHRDDDVTVGVPMAYNCSSSTWSTVLINNSASISSSINYYNSYHRLFLPFLCSTRPRTPTNVYDFVVVVMNLLHFP